MNFDYSNIKINILGLNRAEVERYIDGMIAEYKATLNDLQKEVKFLERTRSKLMVELEEVKKQKVVYKEEVEPAAFTTFDKFKDVSRKRLKRTILLINEIAEQKIDSMVEAASVTMSEYDRELDRLKKEIEENREKIERLLTDVLSLLKMDTSEEENKSEKVEKLSNQEGKSKTTENEPPAFFVNINKREKAQPTLIPKEVETTVIKSNEKYHSAKEEFVDRLAAIMENSTGRNANGAVILLQINEFIMANYFIGCSNGDTISNIIINNIKSYDSNLYIKRLAYDQIGIVYKGRNDIYAISVFAENIINYVQRDIIVDGNKMDLSANIGIALYSKGSNSADVVLNYAGIALYKAKEEGKGVFQFIDDEFIKKIKFINELKIDLTDSIKNDELVLYYQPQFLAETKEIAGFEALLRWKNDKYHDISIFDIIKIAERDNLIDEIGFHIFKMACYFIKGVVARSEKRIVVSVNFSAVQLTRKDFIDNVLAIIKETGISTSYLGFELTETCFIDNFDEICDKLQLIKDMGITVSIDDFGTGYSSLSYLLKLPVNHVKIDKSFLADLESSSKSEIFINSLISITHNLGLQVVAEGVETEKQYQMLKNMNCDYIQGYFLAKPVSEDEAYEYL